MNFDLDRIIKGGILAAVALLVISLAVVPMTIDAAENAKYTIKKNVGTDITYTLTDRAERLEIVIPANSSTVTINGETIDVFRYGTWLASDAIMVDFVPQGDGYHNIFSLSKTERVSVVSTDTRAVTITMEDGEYTYTDLNGNTYTDTYDYILHATSGYGNYIQVGTNRVTLNDDSRIFLFKNEGNYGTSTIVTPTTAGAGSGTGKQYAAGTPPTGTDVSVTWDITENNDDTITIGNIQTSEGATLSGGAMPVEYTTYTNTTGSILMSLVPVILFGALIVIIIGNVMVNRD